MVFVFSAHIVFDDLLEDDDSELRFVTALTMSC